MTKQCRVPGCNRPIRSSIATMCESHRQRWRRHGDPLQPTIKKSELKTYIRFVERLIDQDQSGRVSTALMSIKTHLESKALGVVGDFDRGRPGDYRRVRACRELLNVSKATDHIKPALLMGAMFLLWQEQPYRFASDRGFYFEMTRLFRSLAPQNTASYWNHKTGRAHKVYRELSHSVISTIGDMILEPYLPWIARVKASWEAHRNHRAEISRLLNEGLRGVDQE